MKFGLWYISFMANIHKKPVEKFEFIALTKLNNYCIIIVGNSMYVWNLHRPLLEIFCVYVLAADWRFYIMKNVILLGDSIRMGYESAVKNSLQGIVDVYSPKDGNLYASHLFRFVHEFRSLVPGEVDVLHWNAGLWDVMRNLEEEPQTPIEIYKY